MTPSRLIHAVAVSTLLAVTSIAGAATTEFRVFFDTDRDSTTGCNVGGMLGVEQVLTTRVEDVPPNGANVVLVQRQLCSGNALGSPIDVDTSGWPAVFEPGARELTFETRIRLDAFGSNGIPQDLRLGFETKRGSATHTSLLDDDGSDIIIPAPPVRRRAVGPPGAARNIILDGSLSDWQGIDSTVYGIASEGSQALRVLRVFSWFDPSGNPSEKFLYFAVVARLSSDMPFADDDTYTRRKGQNLAVAGPGVLQNDGDPFGLPLEAIKVTDPERGSVALNDDGSFTYSPDHPQSMTPDEFEYKVKTQDNRESNVARVEIKVTDAAGNEPPSFTAGGDVTVDEDSGLYDQTWATNVSAGPSEDAQTVFFTVTNDNPSLFFTQPSISPDGKLRFDPNTNAHGEATVTVKLTDSEGASTSNVTFTITVNPVNDEPSFTAGPNQTVAEDSGPQTVNPWATAISPGPADEVGEGQTVSFSIVSNTNPTLFSAGPSVSPTGVLTYTPAPNANGVATIRVRLTDTGTPPASSPNRLFTITITPVNDDPSFTAGGDVAVNEDSGAYSAVWATAVSPGPLEPTQTVSFTVTNDNNALFSAQPAIAPNGTLTFTPALDANGSAIVSVTLFDNLGGSSAPAVTFTINVNSVNDVPSFVEGSDVTVLDTAGPQTITPWATSLSAGPANESGQLLDFLLTNDSPGLFSVQPAIAPNGTLTFTPLVGTDGIATLTVRIHDDGGTANGGVDTSAPQTLIITIDKVPTITSANTTTFLVGQAGTFDVTTTGRPRPDIAQTGTLPAGVTFVDGSGPTQGTGVLSGTPAALSGGSYPLTFQATNVHGSSPIQNFTLIVNEAPGITSPNSATFTQGSPGTFTVTTIGYPDPAITIAPLVLPTGLSFTDNLDGTATISGTPTAAGGSYGGFTLTASNGVGANAVQSFTIIINEAPVITSANSTTFNATVPATFTVTTTGFPAPSLGQTGALPTGITFTDNGNGTATLGGTALQGTGGVYSITITATNAAGSFPQTFTITVCNVIAVTNPANATGPAGSPFSETFTQTGAVGSATFTLASGTLPTGLTLSTAGVLSGTPTQGGTFPITVLVTDANGCTGVSGTYNLVITCPTITVTNPANGNGTASSPFSETFTESGGVGSPTFTLATGTLPTGLTLVANGVLSGTPTQTGSFPITVTSTDANGCSGTGTTYTIVIACQVITVNNPANANGTANSAFSETFTNTGAIGAVTYSLASGTLPAGLTLAANGVLSGTPTQTGSFPITVTVTDSNGCTGTGGTYTIIIGCQTITVTNPANTAGTASSPFSETFTQTGAIGTATFTTASTLPTGLTLSAAGVLSGTPTQTGSFPIVVTVTDSNGCTGTSSTYTLNIGCQTITVTNPANTAGTVSAPFSETFTQTGAIGTATFTTASTLPLGVTLAANGVLSGTPTQPGSFPIVVTVTDSNGCTGTSATYTLVIACQTITVTNPANATGPAGSPFSETFTQTGAIGSATFTTTSTLPTGLTLSTAGVLSGTPMQGGTFPIVVTVTDSNGCTGTSATYTLIITCPVITVNNPANANGIAGSAFSETFTQSGGIGTITYTLATGTLPTGLTLSTAGVLSGTPTQTGSFPITVTATDQNGCTGTGTTYTIVIACQTITVNNPANANGTANSPFSETFTNTGAIGSVTYSLASGTLPAGLTLSSAGVLSGTPTQTGSFPITVTVTDANGCTGTSATYNLFIACQTITVTNPVNTNGTIGSPFSETFTQTGAIGAATFSTVSALPPGITLSTAGVLSGTPTSGQGSYPIVVTVTDSNGCTGTGATYTLVIACQTITVTDPANSNGTVGVAFSETFTQTGAIGTANFTTASTLPAGITLATNGVLSGIPMQSGSFPLTVVVTDSNGCTGTSTTYTLVIACQTITVTNPANTAGTVDALFSETFTESGAVGAATFTTSSTLPSGLTLSTAGVLSGTPGQPGSFPIVVTVTDANGCTGTSATYTLVIACQTITVNNPGVTTGTVDAPFSQTFTQTGVGTHTPATFTTSSTLPSGLTLSSAGVLSGTPGQPGTFPIVVTVTDVNGCTGTSATYNLVIACQVITVNNPVVTTATFNAAFSQTFTQTGVGTHTPATFTTTSTLPTGITLSSAGVLSGTPTQTGTFPIVVTVTDVNGCDGTGATYTLAVAPVANADSYSNAVDNTHLVLTGGTTATPSTPSVQIAGSIRTNDLPAGNVTVVSGVFATTAGGSVTLAADGTFLYTPPVNSGIAAITLDTFSYTVTSNTGGTGPVTSAPATVTINLANRVWYVKNDAAGGGNGQSHLPFNTLASAQTASTANDHVFVYVGDAVTTNQNAGFVLKNGQRLLGHGLALVVNTHTLVAAATQPQIGNSGGIGVTIGNAVNTTIAGLSIAGSTNAIGMTTSAAAAGTTTITSNTIRGAGAEGIDVNLNAGTSGTLVLAVTNNAWNTAGTHAGNAIDIVRTAGTLNLNVSSNTNILSTSGAGININGVITVTGFDSNSVHANTTGQGIVVNTATFDSDPVSAGFQSVTGGTTNIGQSGNGVGTAGMTLTTVAGDLSFTDLNIYADNGSGLSLTSTGPANLSGATGMRLAVAANAGDIIATGGPAVSVNNATIDLRLNSMSSTNTTTTGVSLISVSDSTGPVTSALFSAPSGSTITTTAGATGPAFNVSGGNTGVSYAGTITNNATGGRAVSVSTWAGDDATDDMTFSGAIDENGSGILLNGNAGTRSVTFSGGLDIDTTTGEGFAATSNTFASLTITGTNDITSTSATALRVTSTPIGAGHLTFRNISSGNATAAADPVNGIVIDSTGASGSLRVQGTGSANTGGTIQNTTGHAISLNSTLHPQFAWMNIQNIGRSGIDGFGVTNFTLGNSTINNVGTAAAGQYEESNISFNDGGAFTGSSVSGTVSISNNTLTNARRHGVDIQNGTGTISNLTIQNNIITSSTSAAASLGHGILVFTQGSAATNAHLTTATISGNTITFFPTGSGINIAGGTGNATNGTSSTLGAAGTPIGVTGNFIGGSAGTKMGQNAIIITFNGQVGVSNFNVSSNGTVGTPLSHFQGIGISMFMGGTVTGTHTVNNNVIASQQTIAAGSSGIAVQADDGPAGLGTSAANLTVTINGNSVSQNEGSGIRAIARASLATMDVTIQNNSVTAPTMTNRNGIRVDSGSAVGDTTLCLVMTGNTSDGSGVNAGMGIRKQGVVAGTNEFGIVGLAPSPTTGVNAAAKITADNPLGNGTDDVSGDNFVNCTQ